MNDTLVQEKQQKAFQAIVAADVQREITIKHFTVLLPFIIKKQQVISGIN